MLARSLRTILRPSTGLPDTAPREILADLKGIEQERADALALKEPVEAWVDWANKPGSIDHLLYTWHLRRALAKVWKALLPYVE
ncbi:hypothetical protein PtB15_8B168 [Puccinia triticina]|nr:hypothetical protein PtB15_8B168 [Puccinia triticina]